MTTDNTTQAADTTPKGTKMEDGSLVEFGARDKVKKMSKVVTEGDQAGGVEIKFAFNNGAIRTFYMAPIDVLFARAAQHGLDQKFGDAFAGVDLVDDCVATFEKVATNLSNGDWTKGREGDGMAGTSILAKALVKVTGQSKEDVAKKLASLDADQKKALKKQTAVAAAIAEIEAERDAKKEQKGPSGDDVLGLFKAAA